jgi:hypothetical protein
MHIIRAPIQGSALKMTNCSKLDWWRWQRNVQNNCILMVIICMYSWPMFCLPRGENGSFQVVLIAYFPSQADNKKVILLRIKRHEVCPAFPLFSSSKVNTSDYIGTWCLSINNTINIQSCKHYHKIICFLYTSACTWHNFLLRCFSLVTQQTNKNRNTLSPNWQLFIGRPTCTWKG